MSTLDIEVIFAHHHGQYEAMPISVLMPSIMLPFVFRHGMKASRMGWRWQGRGLLIVATLYAFALALDIVPFLVYTLSVA